MFHMLTCFNLGPDDTIAGFERSLRDFTAHLQSCQLIHATGPVGRRQRHPIMDTDGERDHEFFFIMSFLDRAQCDKAVEYILPREQPAEASHKAMYKKVRDPIFICWEDI